MRCVALSTEQSELLAEVCHRSFNALLLSALRSDANHRAQLYVELQRLLTSYLEPHVSNRLGTAGSAGASASVRLNQIATTAQQHSLNPRQQMALAYVLEHGSLTIQTFETLCPERSRRTLQRDLKQLINKGLLGSEGDTTQLTYRLASA